MLSTDQDHTSLHVLERMLHEGFALGRTEVVDELCSPDIVEHQLGLAGQGAEAIAKVKKGMTEVHAAFPDLRFTIGDWAERDDIVWVRAEGTGTNTGPFFGPPTGRTVHFTVIDVARIRDGRIVEHWGVPDRFAIMLQLGRIDLPRQP
ncbi:ester cyclase [Leifsonia shinshuensis]|uniref:ester cyclase n=1 Tax=Leifsonia TaxID=110932 RepID=UPI00285AEB77|nr:ester cyclase [Leifsonia shinshuensis]MDR6971602.1 putative ester cyclase [Leifsonia shinshuensis]